MRNSIEFPKWLSQPDIQSKLNGKNILMYCTGGIRCERASALVNQLAAASVASVTSDSGTSSSSKPHFQPAGVYELQGGIERYVKTFPDGGYWNGKNYLFDRRMEQVPANINRNTTVANAANAANAATDAVESAKATSTYIQNTNTNTNSNTNSKCCLCRSSHSLYRGQYSCSKSLCGVPVIVCNSNIHKCVSIAKSSPHLLICEVSHVQCPMYSV